MTLRKKSSENIVGKGENAGNHRVENIVGKEEIACTSKFLLFPQCFQKVFPRPVKKVSLCGNGLNDVGPYSLTTLKNVLCRVLQVFLYLAVFECNTASKWLNHTVYGLTNQKLCYIQIYKILEKKMKNVLENGW